MASNEKDFMLTDDMELDAIEDMPGFVCWPSGGYNCTLNLGVVEDNVNDHPVYKIPLTLDEVVGVTDDVEESEIPKKGDELELMFMRDNKMGAANYKTFMIAIGRALGVKTVREANEGSKGVSVSILMNKRQSKKDKTKFYPQILEVSVL